MMSHIKVCWHRVHGIDPCALHPGVVLQDPDRSMQGLRHPTADVAGWTASPENKSPRAAANKGGYATCPPPRHRHGPPSPRTNAASIQFSHLCQLYAQWHAVKCHPSNMTHSRTDERPDAPRRRFTPCWCVHWRESATSNKRCYGSCDVQRRVCNWMFCWSAELTRVAGPPSRFAPRNGPSPPSRRPWPIASLL